MFVLFIVLFIMNYDTLQSSFEILYQDIIYASRPGFILATQFVIEKRNA